MKKIGFFNSVKTWGGGEKWHFEAAVYFAAQGYAIHFFLAENSKLHLRLKEHSRIQLHFVQVSGLSFLNRSKVINLKKIFIETGIELILMNLPSDLKAAGQAATKANVPKVIYRRGSAIPIKNSFLNRYIFSHWVTEILANSEATKKTIRQNNPKLFPKEKIRVIYNPIDTKEFINRPYRIIYTKQPGEIVLAHLGRLEKQKNQVFLISLAVALKKKGIPHKILIGGTGRLEKELIELAAQKDVNEQIIFKGFLPNVKDLLMSSDIFILPSLWEGFGFVLAEASLCKKPIVAFNISSNPEVVLDDKTGFLTEVNDVDACVDKIILLKNNPGRAASLGESGFNFICRTFEKSKIMKELEAYLNA